MRAALMARVSTDEQAAGDRHSLPAQLSAMRERCAREGWEVVREFVAEGESAFTPDIARRPVLRAAIEAAERREFEVILVHEASRFARNIRLEGEARARLERAGVRVVAADEPLAPETPDRWFMQSVITPGINELYSRQLSQHIRKGLGRRFALGLPPNGMIPFGYRPGATPLDAPEVVPEEADAVRWAYRTFAALGSYLSIAEEFNRRGLRPHSRARRVGSTGIVRAPNEQFSMTALQSILENEFYLGFVTHRGERRRGLHAPIVGEDDWAAAQARKRRGGRVSRSLHLLSGLAVCRRCERTLTAERTSATRAYYRERRDGVLRTCPNTGRGWPQPEVDALVSATIEEMPLRGEWLAHCERRARRRDTSGASARAALVEEQRRATNAYMAGALGEAEWRERLASVQGRLAELPPDVDTLLFAGSRVTSIAEVWAVADAEDRRAAVRLLFRSVRLDVATRGLWVEPWPEYEPLFGERRRWRASGGKYARRDSNPVSPSPRLYTPAELGVA